MYLNSRKFFDDNSKTILKVVWTLSWITATLYTTIEQCINFFTAQDQTIIEYRTFNEMETDVYPSVSLCWREAIIKEKLERYGNGFTFAGYSKFLMGESLGEHWEKDMLTVDYDDVTVRFEDYLFGYGYIQSSFETIPLYDKEKGIRTMSRFKDTSVFNQRCLTVDIPFEKDNQINTFYVALKPEIFGNIMGHLGLNTFAVVLHYPNQLLGRINLGSMNWNLKGTGFESLYLLTVGHVEVLVERNKKKRPCIEGIPNYDQELIQDVLELVGCKPPYWNSTSSLPSCSKQKELQHFRDWFLEISTRGNKRTWASFEDTPCRRMARIHYDLQTRNDPFLIDAIEKLNEMKLNRTTVVIGLDFTEFTYKEVRNIRGMDHQALIGKDYYKAFDISHIDNN